MVTISSEEENHFTGQLVKVMLCWVLNEVNNWTCVGTSTRFAYHPSNGHGTLEENKQYTNVNCWTNDYQFFLPLCSIDTLFSASCSLFFPIGNHVEQRKSTNKWYTYFSLAGTTIKFGNQLWPTETLPRRIIEICRPLSQENDFLRDRYKCLFKKKIENSAENFYPRAYWKVTKCSH